ncbi:Fringe-like protein [Metarhizium album ARSEF 1941]|uniref:N-acetylgalactosaminide beta-1,3-galactosyltransferase n=1 Tax=Metarhizium album (strain ARSEF 1941) TaxID=1081103 RepID=A0A0B2WUR0_METAS|nr:Fringe-like protein [Metarhizium album ARSEF 1941]KHN99781.1 Fringe-like protein [Metarhizium album ARSEF 1941]
MTMLSGLFEARRMSLMLTRRVVRTVIGVLAFVLTAAMLLTFPRHDQASKRGLLPFDREHVGPAAYAAESASHFSPVAFDDPEGTSRADLCASFPSHLLNHVQPVLKIGHSEDGDRLRASFSSVSSCFDKDDLLVVSDTDEVVHGHRTVDVLAHLPAACYNLTANPDFRNYMEQREMQKNGTLKDKTQTPINGWILDKYKFLPMVERAWLAKPGKAFYFFYEADTYVFWDNVFRFLQAFDPDTPIYMGSPSPGRHDADRDADTWFANGGPGVVLSRAAIKALLHRETDANGHYVEPHVTEKWQHLVAEDCCGDSVLGWALWNSTVQLQGYWPMFNPHPLHNIPFGDLHWCQPALTLHKTQPKDMVDLWHWEFGKRQLHRPMLYSDLWHLRLPGGHGTLKNWDNGDWDGWAPPAEASINSPETCEQYCHGHGDCLQWNWRGGDEKRCIAMKSVRYGAARNPEYLLDGGGSEAIPDDEVDGKPRGKWVEYRSGWVQDRIESWRSKRHCEQAHWVGPSISRVF